MFDEIPVRVWLLILIAILAYHPAHYVVQHIAASPARRDITQPSKDLSWRTSADLLRSLAILAALLALAIFIFTPAAEQFARSPSFWPLLMVGVGAWSLYTVPQGLRTGQIQPFIRGINSTFDRQTQPKRYWASVGWNALLGSLCVGFAYPMYGDMREQPIKDRCFGSKAEVSPHDKLAACAELIASRDSSHDDYANLLIARGNAHYRLGDYRQALPDYDQAVRIDPSDPYARYNRALVYDALGDHPRAISDYTETIRLRPDDADAYLDRGIILLNTGKFDMAIADLTRSHQLQPEDPWSLANRGLTYALTDNKERAEEDLKVARDIDPANPVMLRGEGVLAMKAGDFRLTVDRLTKSLKVEPDNEWTLAMRAEAYRRLGEFEKSRADSAKLATLRSKK